MPLLVLITLTKRLGSLEAGTYLCRWQDRCPRSCISFNGKKKSPGYLVTLVNMPYVVSNGTNEKGGGGQEHVLKRRSGGMWTNLSQTLLTSLLT